MLKWIINIIRKRLLVRVYGHYLDVEGAPAMIHMCTSYLGYKDN